MESPITSVRVRRSDVAGLRIIGERGRRSKLADVISYLVAEELKRLGVSPSDRDGNRSRARGREVA